MTADNFFFVGIKLVQNTHFSSPTDGDKLIDAGVYDIEVAFLYPLQRTSFVKVTAGTIHILCHPKRKEAVQSSATSNIYAKNDDFCVTWYLDGSFDNVNWHKSCGYVLNSILAERINSLYTPINEAIYEYIYKQAFDVTHKHLVDHPPNRIYT